MNVDYFANKRKFVLQTIQVVCIHIVFEAFSFPLVIKSPNFSIERDEQNVHACHICTTYIRLAWAVVYLRYRCLAIPITG